MSLKKNFIILIVLLFFPIVFAQSDLDFQIVEVRIDGDVELDFQNSNSRLEYFSADLKLFPKSSYREDVIDLKLEHNPSASIVQRNSIDYRWDDEFEKLSFGYDAKVKVWNRIFQIPTDVPLVNFELSNELKKYVKESEFTDITPAIREKALEISAGSDTLYETTFKIAEWVRTNVEYNLSTLTEDAVQKSSWVLENRYGVCDEITNLFVSFMRSMNIPVRYVVGIAYSDAVEEGWAPHAWAEVYFPGYGWIPFDVTFGQYGWVDTGHVKLAESVGSNEPSVEYTWKAVKVGLKNKNLELNTSIIERGDKIFPLIELDANVVYDKVRGSSLVPLEVSVKNLQNYYLSTLVYITNAPGIVGDNSKVILLKPREEKKLSWILSVPELNGDFTYKSEIKLIESFGSEAKDELLIGDKFELYEMENAEIEINEFENGKNADAKILDEEIELEGKEDAATVIPEEPEFEFPEKENLFRKLLRWLGWI
ncbi:transglutaminase domain-containing protein [Candidatus Woesearchaeota archaeon]|nr:transglutaminase domain-containing protein [Candidatus Woesearchaeota archaeon]